MAIMSGMPMRYAFREVRTRRGRLRTTTRRRWTALIATIAVVATRAVGVGVMLGLDLVPRGRWLTSRRV
jgi:hypothetical protein